MQAMEMKITRSRQGGAQQLRDAIYVDGVRKLKCSKCRGYKTDDEFANRADRASGKASWCRECNNQAHKEWRRNHPHYKNKYRADRKSDPRRFKRYQLKKDYGIKIEEWDLMFSAQESKCAICKATEPGPRGWATDHCHSTGKFRGILCGKCNPLLGYARDNISILTSAIAYLRVHTTEPERINDMLVQVSCDFRLENGAITAPSLGIDRSCLHWRL